MSWEYHRFSDFVMVINVMCNVSRCWMGPSAGVSGEL